MAVTDAPPTTTTVPPGHERHGIDKVVFGVAGTLALRYVDEMEERVQQIVTERERISAGLEQLGVEVWPSGANFILFRPRHRRGRAVWQGLLDRSVLVRDCSGWPRLGDCLRVTVGTAEENSEVLAAMAAVLSEVAA